MALRTFAKATLMYKGVFMLIDAHSADLFIAGYKKLLLEIHQQVGLEPDKDLVQMLVKARAKAVEDPRLIEASLASLRDRGEAIHPEVIDAIKTLKYKQWVFLRETKTYSIFIDGRAGAAYGVLGLTDRIKDLLGASGLALNAGLVCYQGRFVCDGLIDRAFMLGKNNKKSFSDLLSEIKACGRFFAVCPDGRFPLDASK